MIRCQSLNQHMNVTMKISESLPKSGMEAEQRNERLAPRRPTVDCNGTTPDPHPSAQETSKVMKNSSHAEGAAP